MQSVYGSGSTKWFACASRSSTVCMYQQAAYSFYFSTIGFPGRRAVRARPLPSFFFLFDSLLPAGLLLASNCMPCGSPRPVIVRVAMTTTRRRRCLVLFVLQQLLLASSAACGAALVGDSCSASSGRCGVGLRCTACVAPPGTGPSACARTTPLDPKKAGTSLPFNRYSWLTTHNSFAVVGTRSPLGSAIISPPNQEDSVASQLRNGVRGLMLDAYDFRGDVWFCHSFGGRCLPFTAYAPALAVLRDLEAFLASNPSEVVTVFLEDYAAPGSLSNVFNAAGLSRYWFPVDRMPTRPGQDWPLLQDMIASNQRLVVFTSRRGKQGTEGLAYLWDYVVENQYGSEGLVDGRCPRRGESRPMDSPAQSLVLMNFFTSNPSQSWACGNNSAPLLSRLSTCHRAAANRWPNYIAVDFYMRSTGGGAPMATDVANGRLHCGCDNIAHCSPNASSCAFAKPSGPAAATSSGISLPPAPAPAPSSAPPPAPPPH